MTIGDLLNRLAETLDQLDQADAITLTDHNQVIGTRYADIQYKDCGWYVIYHDELSAHSAWESVQAACCDTVQVGCVSVGDIDEEAGRPRTRCCPNCNH